MLFHSRLGWQKVPAGYNPRLSKDRYGISVLCPVETVEFARDILCATEAEEVHVIE
jgi:hypothetical protein